MRTALLLRNLLDQPHVYLPFPVLNRNTLLQVLLHLIVQDGCVVGVSEIARVDVGLVDEDVRFGIAFRDNVDGGLCKVFTAADDLVRWEAVV